MPFCRLFLLITAVPLTGCPFSDPPEVYLIPAGYVGPVVIAYEQEGGTPLTTSGDTLIYTIPGSGVLRTSAQKPGFRHVRYAYLDSDGRRSRLPPNDPDSEPPEDVIQAFGVIGMYLGELVEPPGDTLYVRGGWSTDERSPSEEFLVGRRADFDRLNAQRDSVVTSITHTVIGIAN
jgi:hypothetical protein